MRMGQWGSPQRGWKPLVLTRRSSLPGSKSRGLGLLHRSGHPGAPSERGGLRERGSLAFGQHFQRCRELGQPPSTTCSRSSEGLRRCGLSVPTRGLRHPGVDRPEASPAGIHSLGGEGLLIPSVGGWLLGGEGQWRVDARLGRASMKRACVSLGFQLLEPILGRPLEKPLRPVLGYAPAAKQRNRPTKDVD